MAELNHFIFMLFSSPLQFLERETAQRNWKADDMGNSVGSILNK